MNLRDLILKPPEELSKEELMTNLAELRKLRTLHVATPKSGSATKRRGKGTKTKAIEDELADLAKAGGLDLDKLKKVAEDMGIG